MLIRQFDKEDENLFDLLCKEFYSSNATRREYDQECTEKTFKQVISKHENLWGYFIVDKDHSDAVGYALITSYWCNEEGGNVIILDEIFIRPNDRGKGYAKQFLQWLAEHFENEAVAISLEVLTTNVPAKKLYNQQGFAEDGFVTMTKYMGSKIKLDKIPQH